MANMFGTGLSALSSLQRALNTTSHNIANVNTEGYSRQRVEFATRPPEFTGAGFIGSGVDTVAVERVFDSFINTRLSQTTSSYSREQTYLDFAAQVDDLLADSEAGLTPGLQSFFNAVQEVADDPTSTAARQVMLTEGETLVDRFRYLDQRMDDLRATLNSQFRTVVDEVNSLAENIAQLNVDITAAYGYGSGNPPNDLLDQRDALVGRLSELVAVQTVEQDDGALNVFIGSGQTLVVGADTTRLSAVATGPDLDQLDIVYQTPGGGAVPVTDLITGGKLGGMINFREEVLDAAQNGLGRIAMGLASTFNAQHAQGMDLEGALGGDFFSQPQPQVYESATNSSAVNVSLADVSQLTVEDYELRYDGAAWNLTRASDGQSVPMSGSGTAADPFIVDGIGIEVSGVPAAGDYALIRPTRLAASRIDVAVTNIRQIAAAGAVYSEADIANGGSAEISPAQVLDPSDPNLLNSVTIDFLDPTTYTVNGGPPQAYTSGADIDVNGWRVQISGSPVAGDAFIVRSNAGGVGDNRNALALAGLQNALTLEAGAGGPTASISGAYEQIVADVGTNTRAAQYNASAQETLLQQARAQRDSVSGVNLDEEAANLLRFQQAYQAAAQVIAVSEGLFQTLIAAVRR